MRNVGCRPFGGAATRRWRRTPRPQAYVRQLEQAYDATGETAPRPRREDDFNPEQLMHELEDFLRQERERGAE